VTISCGHMFCKSCTDRLPRPKKCPNCRDPITGYIECLPFAG
jgi:primosomal protein N'